MLIVRAANTLYMEDVEEMKTGLRHLQSVNRDVAQLPLPVRIILEYENIYGQPCFAIIIISY